MVHAKSVHWTGPRYQQDDNIAWPLRIISNYLIWRPMWSAAISHTLFQIFSWDRKIAVVHVQSEHNTVQNGLWKNFFSRQPFDSQVSKLAVFVRMRMFSSFEHAALKTSIWSIWPKLSPSIGFRMFGVSLDNAWQQLILNAFPSFLMEKAD